MGILTVCKLSDQSDVIIRRRSLRRYDIEIKRFSITDGFVHPNAWPKHMDTFFGNMSRTGVRHILAEAREAGVHVPKFINEYFDFPSHFRRAYLLVRSFFH